MILYDIVRKQQITGQNNTKQYISTHIVRKNMNET